jgi:hypothetical protein
MGGFAFSQFGLINIREDTDEEVVESFSPEERRLILQMKDTQRLYQRLARSIAPSVHGTASRCVVKAYECIFSHLLGITLHSLFLCSLFSSYQSYLPFFIYPYQVTKRSNAVSC